MDNNRAIKLNFRFTKLIESNINEMQVNNIN